MITYILANKNYLIYSPSVSQQEALENRELLDDQTAITEWAGDAAIHYQGGKKKETRFNLSRWPLDEKKKNKQPE